MLNHSAPVCEQISIPKPRYPNLCHRQSIFLATQSDSALLFEFLYFDQIEAFFSHMGITNNISISNVWGVESPLHPASVARNPGEILAMKHKRTRIKVQFISTVEPFCDEYKNNLPTNDIQFEQQYITSRHTMFKPSATLCIPKFMNTSHPDSYYSMGWCGAIQPFMHRHYILIVTKHVPVFGTKHIKMI